MKFLISGKISFITQLKEGSPWMKLQLSEAVWNKDKKIYELLGTKSDYILITDDLLGNLRNGAAVTIKGTIAKKESDYWSVVKSADLKTSDFTADEIQAKSYYEYTFFARSIEKVEAKMDTYLESKE